MPFNPFEHRPSWEPGPFRHAARSFGQWLTNIGRSIIDVASRLAEEFGIRQSTATQIAANAETYATLLDDTFGDCDPNAKLARNQIYRNATLRDAYRVVVNIPFYELDASSGEPGDTPDSYMTVVTDWDHNPTYDEVRQAAANMAEQLLSEAPGHYEQLDLEPAYGCPDIVTVERRT